MAKHLQIMSIKTILLTCTLLTCTLLACPGMNAWADCSPLMNINCEYGFRSGTIWFGAYADGGSSSLGQSITLDCPTQLLGVEFQFTISGYGGNGVLPLMPGDEVAMKVLATDGELLATTTALLTGPITTSINAPWIFFDFTGENVLLEPGQYILGAYTDLPLKAGISACFNDDAYAGGTALGSADKFVSWRARPNDDLPFRLYRESEPVATEGVTWSTIKANYR